jgi:heterodisulfide reductase subunit A
MNDKQRNGQPQGAVANSGFYVYMVEKSPGIGGVMAQLDKTFPTNDCSM